MISVVFSVYNRVLLTTSLYYFLVDSTGTVIIICYVLSNYIIIMYLSYFWNLVFLSSIEYDRENKYQVLHLHTCHMVLLLFAFGLGSSQSRFPLFEIAEFPDRFHWFAL